VGKGEGTIDVVGLGDYLGREFKESLLRDRERRGGFEQAGAT